MTKFDTIVDWLDATEGYDETDWERGRAELARLALIATGANSFRRGECSFDGMTERRALAPRVMPGMGGRSLSRPMSTLSRLAVLIGAGTIASLAMIFG